MKSQNKHSAYPVHTLFNFLYVLVYGHYTIRSFWMIGEILTHFGWILTSVNCFWTIYHWNMNICVRFIKDLVEFGTLIPFLKILSAPAIILWQHHLYYTLFAFYSIRIDLLHRYRHIHSPSGSPSPESWRSNITWFCQRLFFSGIYRNTWSQTQL